jgi:hypothetical protein
LYFSGGCIPINPNLSYYCRYLHWYGPFKIASEIFENFDISSNVFLWETSGGSSKVFLGGANQWRNHQPSAEGARFLGGSGGILPRENF